MFDHLRSNFVALAGPEGVAVAHRLTSLHPGKGPEPDVLERATDCAAHARGTTGARRYHGGAVSTMSTVSCG